MKNYKDNNQLNKAKAITYLFSAMIFGGAMIFGAQISKVNSEMNQLEKNVRKIHATEFVESWKKDFSPVHKLQTLGTYFTAKKYAEDKDSL